MGVGMEPLQWNPSLAVGQGEIDGQHRELFERAGHFFAVRGAPDKVPQISAAFMYLDSYVRFHFAQEEKLMLRIGYPELVEHQGEHRDYIRRLDSVKSQFESEGDSAAVAMALDGLLRLWLVDHIGQADKRVGDFAARAPGAR